MEAAEILKKIRALEIKTKGLVQSAFAGDYHSVFKGRGMNFEDVREYQPGDEIRAIDWNVTARLGNAFVKKFTEERELTVMLVVDVSASGNFGSVAQSKRELAAEVACLLAFSAIRNNDKVGLVLFSDQVELFIPPKKGRSHTLRLIREILYFRAAGPRHAAEPRARLFEPRRHPALGRFFHLRFPGGGFFTRPNDHEPAARFCRHPDRRRTRRIAPRHRPHHFGGRRDGRANRDQHRRPPPPHPFQRSRARPAGRNQSHPATQQHRHHLAPHERRLSAGAAGFFKQRERRMARR